MRRLNHPRSVVTLWKRISFLIASVTFLLTLCSTGWGLDDESILHTFTDENGDGSQPLGGVVFDKAGKLYGTTWGGGQYQSGAIYELSPNAEGGWTEQVIYSFTGGNDGTSPTAGLAIDQLGNLYGSTKFGGSESKGTVFELSPTPNGWAFNLIYTFTGGDDGAYPSAALTLDASGNIYGTAFEGGAHSVGTAFTLQLNSGHWEFSLLHTFTGGKDGGYPSANFIFDSVGNLYATTSYGGSGDSCYMGCGTVYELLPSSGGWHEKVLHNFNGGVSGSYPGGGLIFDSNGNLYGVAAGGGRHDEGIVYELLGTSGKWSYKSLYSFIGKPDGASPDGSLVFDPEGNLYGTAGVGGVGFGTAFELTPSAGKWDFVLLHTFYVEHSDGANPTGSLVLDAYGNLYGTAAGGGEPAAGLVFELSPPDPKMKR